MAGKEVGCPSSYTISEHAPLDFIKDMEEARVKGMVHFAHQHRLEFKERLKYEEGENEWLQNRIICDACGLQIEGCGFSCSVGGDLLSKRFHLHQICAFLPRQLSNYPNHHSQHTLTLYQNDHIPFLPANQMCNLCYNLIDTRYFFYRCDMCSFCIDVRCASKKILVCGNTHDHPLSPKLYPASFECSLCRQKLGKLAVYYECNTCTFMIHEECYSPPPIKHASHAHPLHITYGFRERLHKCNICNESEFEKETMIYSCAKCKYYIHRHCSLNKWKKIRPIQTSEVKGELIEFPMPNVQSIEDILSHFIIQKCEWKAEDITEPPLLKHACHDHPLVVVVNNSIVSGRSCSACSLLISDANSFYSCTQLSCKFVLHKWCAKLPLKMQHPAHPRHTLLLLKSHKELLIPCSGCQQRGNGFFYMCTEYECSFNIDLICACFPSYVKHETHKDPLLLSSNTLSRSCTSCGDGIEQRFSFGCDACTFSIDIRCLLLPREITHWYDREHGFKLTYDPPICQQGYHCEFCEEELDTNNWIYHCFECDWSLDTKCVRKAFNLFQSSMVLGRSQDSPLHKHPLTCVLVPREWHTFCSQCSKNNYKNDGYGFSCTECKIVFCTDCVWDGLSSPVEIVPKIDAETVSSYKEDAETVPWYEDDVPPYDEDYINLFEHGRKHRSKRKPRWSRRLHYY